SASRSTTSCSARSSRKHPRFSCTRRTRPRCCSLTSRGSGSSPRERSPTWKRPRSNDDPGRACSRGPGPAERVTAFIAGRLLALLPVLWGVSLLVFLLIHLIPGDALQLFLGTQVTLTPQQMEELRRLFGLNKSL